MNREVIFYASGMLRFAGWCWLTTALYFPISVVVASAWDAPRYDVRANFISDLAVTTCGRFPERGGVCSPSHALMNANLVLVGLLIAAGAVVWLRVADRGARAPLAGFVGAGIAAALVGVFPLDRAHEAHTAAATVFLVLHLVSMIGMAAALREPWLAWWTAWWSVVSVVGVVALQTSGNLGLGIGVAERLALDSLAIWRVGVGFWLIGTTPAPGILDHR